MPDPTRMFKAAQKSAKAGVEEAGENAFKLMKKLVPDAAKKGAEGQRKNKAKGRSNSPFDKNSRLKLK